MSIPKVNDLASSIRMSPQPVIASNRIDTAVKVLMTNEKSWFGKIVEYIRSLFGSVTPGSLTDVCNNTNQVVKNVLAKSDLTISVDRFYVSLLKRVYTLKLPLSQKETTEVASRLMQNALKGKTVDSTVKESLFNQIQAFAPVETVRVGKTWTRRTVEVLTGATLLGAAALGGAYWAGYDLSVLHVSALRNTEVSKSVSDALTSSTDYVYNQTVAVRTYVSSCMPSFPSIYLPSLPSFESFNISGMFWSSAENSSIKSENTSIAENPQPAAKSLAAEVDKNIPKNSFLGHKGKSKRPSV